MAAYLILLLLAVVVFVMFSCRTALLRSITAYVYRHDVPLPPFLRFLKALTERYSVSRLAAGRKRRWAKAPRASNVGTRVPFQDLKCEPSGDDEMEKARSTCQEVDFATRMMMTSCPNHRAANVSILECLQPHLSKRKCNHGATEMSCRRNKSCLNVKPEEPGVSMLEWMNYNAKRMAPAIDKIDCRVNGAKQMAEPRWNFPNAQADVVMDRFQPPLLRGT